MFDDIAFRHKSYTPLLIPLEKLHLTLGVMTIDAANTSFLKDLSNVVDDALVKHFQRGPIQLCFRGLGTFNHGHVLFSRVVAEEDYMRLEQMVRFLRAEIGGGLNIDIQGNPHDSYVPHITLAKIRPQLKHQFGTEIPHEIWAQDRFSDFGRVSFRAIDLCEMKSDPHTGYYSVVHTASL
jgi:2'-5' RNA ligase